MDDLDLLEYEVNCLAMAIVNHTNENTGVSVEVRQNTNNHNFDFAVNKIKEFLGLSEEHER